MDTVNRMLENQARFIAGVQRGVEQADRGELVEYKEVLNRSR
jgi:predicted transcriptional regulator